MKSLPCAWRNRKANWKENQPTVNYSYNCSTRCTIPHLRLQVHGSNVSWFSVVGSRDTIRASHPGENPKASPWSTQPGNMSNYIFVLVSLPCGFNTHLPLNVSGEKRSESLAGWRCRLSLQQEGLQWDLCLTHGKSSSTTTKIGRERNVRGVGVSTRETEMETLHYRLSKSRVAFSKTQI